MHQFGLLSEKGDNFFNLLQKGGGGGVPSEKGRFQTWRKLYVSDILTAAFSNDKIECLFTP